MVVERGENMIDDTGMFLQVSQIAIS